MLILNRVVIGRASRRLTTELTKARGKKNGHVSNYGRPSQSLGQISIQSSPVNIQSEHTL